MDYTKLLNEEQIKPVLDTEGAVLVLAGAGSGKTRVLTHRVSYLMSELGVPACNILAITFTNKAAKEMQERVIAIASEDDSPWISTFHSFCAKVLRYDIEKLGYTSNYSIFTSNDSTKVVARILKELNIDDNEVKKTVRNHISNAKNIGASVDDYCNQLGGRNSDLIRDVFNKYESELKRNNALDFDDLLLKTVILFKDFPEVLAKYQERFKYIHIDEFQDTNKIQMLLVRMIADKHKNLFVVGDDDQSIYGWRGAEVENILNFKKFYPNCRAYKLQQNYRSTGSIIQCANAVIQNNKTRMGKELWTEADKGMKVTYKNCFNDKEEVDFVLGEIRKLIDYNNYSFNDFAILVRVNALTRIFEEKMNLYGMRYKLIGGFKFYDRKEIMDTIAYLRMVANPYDEESIIRIINFPKRGIGDTAIEKMRNYCYAKGVSFIDGLIAVEDNEVLTKAMKTKFMSFRDLVVDLMNKKLDLPFDEFMSYMVNRIDFYTVYDMDNAEDKNKLENIDEFINVVKEFCKANEGATLEDFMQSVALISDSEDSDTDEYITMATIHGVKGLEYKTVFLVGLEEGIFPSSRALNDPKDMEEERRCMYVAITRAKDRLYVSSAGSRFRFGKVEYNAVSRFVTEADLVKKDPASFELLAKSKYASIITNPQRPSQGASSNAGGITKDLTAYVVGAVVVHSRFGEGTILSRDGENGTINFAKLGNKNFNLKLTPITIKV